MKEYAGGGKNVQEQYFEYKLSSARIVIENSFGRLKGRFGCLKRPMDVNIVDLPNLIYSTFIQHNFCELRRETISEQNFEAVIDFERRTQPPVAAIGWRESINMPQAKKIRGIFTAYFE